MQDQFLMIPYEILSDKEWSLSHKAVFCYLDGWIKSTGNAFPGVDKIADTLGLSTRTVKRCTADLEESGKISKVRQYNKPNIYLCNWLGMGQNDPINSDKMAPHRGQNDPIEVTKWPTIILDITSDIRSDSLNQLKEPMKEEKEVIVLTSPTLSESVIEPRPNFSKFLDEHPNLKSSSLENQLKAYDAIPNNRKQ